MKTIHQCHSCGATIHQDQTNGAIQAYIPAVFILYQWDERADRIFIEMIRLIGWNSPAIPREEFEAYFNYCLIVLGIELNDQEYEHLFNLVYDRVLKNVCNGS